MGISGLASNFDWRSLVDRLAQAERSPQTTMRREQQSIQDRKDAYASLVTELTTLQDRVKALSDPNLFDARAATSSDTTLASASAEPGASLGSYAFHIIHRAAASIRLGSASVARSLNATNDVSALTLGTAALPAPLKDGTFTINGQVISVSGTDPLQAVFDRIHAATGGDVTGSYDATTDKITLTSASNAEIVLGSAADTSNFLQVTRLSNNGTATTSSSVALGSVQLAATLASANLATAITDGGAGAGSFKVNGVEISFDAAKDSIGDVLKRINDSTAGVTASYDNIGGRFLLTNKTTGDLGVALQDVTGNFLAATGLSGGTLQHGTDLAYTINGGGQLTSHSNMITGDSSGIVGLSVTVQQAGDFTVDVASDTGRVKKAITDFIDEYNKTQALIETNTASSTDSKGKVTAGTLATEGDASTIASELRRQVTGTFSFLTGTLKRLEGMGVTSNGDDNALSLSDSTKLDDALAGSLNDVKALFTEKTSGLAVTLKDYLDRTVGDKGSLIGKQDTLAKQVTGIDDQIAQQEKQVQVDRDQLITGFLAMEQAQQQINQQLQFLAQRFGTTTSSSG